MRRLWILVGGAVLLVTAAWWMFLISPRNGEIDRLEREQTIALDAEQRLRAQIQQLEEIRSSEVQYLAALGTLEGLIPERPLLEAFIEQIFELSNETGVQLLTLAPGLPTTPDDQTELRSVDVSIQIEGSFFEVLGFLFGLSDLERLVRIDSVATASSQNEAGETVLSASLEIKLFTLADLLPISEELTAISDDEVGADDGGADDGGADQGTQSEAAADGGGS
jgi:Tfp pilus assembly protein PilO